jgi:hypothetical protein
MGSPDHIHRASRLVAERTDEKDVFRAAEQLRRLAVQVVIDPSCIASAAFESAILTIVNAGHRTLLGGVQVVAPPNSTTVSRLGMGRTLAEAVVAFGGTVVDRPAPGVPTIVVGFSRSVPLAPASVRLELCRWTAAVSPADGPAVFSANDALPLAGVLGGAIALSEVFDHAIGLHNDACQRQIGLSLWNPDPAYDWRNASEEPTVRALPDSLWLIGLGHLGQGYLWALSTLQYNTPEDVEIWLQDDDRVGTETISTGLLSFEGDIGQMKTRAVATRLEQVGFCTRIIERRLTRGNARGGDTPTLILAGVDSSSSRIEIVEAFRSADPAPSIIDVGLGAQTNDFDQLTLHASPFGDADLNRLHEAQRREAQRAVALARTAVLEQIAAASSLDACGLIRLASIAVGVPYVGAAAGAIVVAEILRRLANSAPTRAFSFDLRNPDLRLAPAVHSSPDHHITFTY